MFDTILRGLKEQIFTSSAKVVAKYLTATQLTLAGLFCGFVSFFLFCFDLPELGQLFWWLNRLFDGIDGEVARVSKSESDFGAYLDIICDFSVYAILPIGIVFGQSDVSREGFLALGFLEGAYFVNAGSLFLLSSIVEKRGFGRKVTGEKTSVSFPRGIIEGGETMVFYFLFIMFRDQVTFLFTLFGSLVTLTILHRLHWAYKNLN